MHKISEFFKFTPYDNKVSLGIVPNDITPEEFFWSSMYVDFPTGNENILKELISSVESPNNHIVLFIGTSGSGKTTYLHHVDFEQKKAHGDKYASDFFNLIEKPSLTDGISILNTNVDSKLYSVLDKETIGDLQTLIDKYVKQCENGEYVWDTTFLKGRDYDYHKEFDNFIGSSDYYYTKQSVIQFCKLINNIPEKIALYLIAYTLKEGVKFNKKCVFIFDNMDEISQENLLAFINDDINNAFSKAQSFFEKYCPSYKFRDNCTLIISVRKTFTSYNATQLIDRYGNTTNTIVFDNTCRANLASIIEHRISLYLSQVGIDDNEKYRVNKIHAITKNDLRFFNDLGQLCNYDNRKVLSAIGNVYEMQVDPYYFKCLDHPSLKAGARGTFMFVICYGRISDQTSRFRTYMAADVEHDGCNLYRMLFTLLANMAGTIDESGGQESIFIQKNSVSLLDFTELIQKLYDRNLIKTIYEALFVSGNISHAIPATLFGGEIDQFILKKQYNANLNELCEYISAKYNKNKNDLSQIIIHVNPLCGAYAERVFIHYEYFNVLSLLDKKVIDARLKKPAQSLFLLHKKDDIINCLERVYKITEAIITKADEHFCRLCNKKMCPKGQNNWRENCMDAIKSFANDSFLIKDTLYSSRVITSHIRYLDVFRKYQSIFSLQKGESFDIDINLTIITYIEKYIYLYERKAVRDDTIKKVIDEMKYAIIEAKESPCFIPITKEIN